MSGKRLNRRDFLRMSTLTAASAILAACSKPTAEVIKETVKETVEVPVEKTVKETVQVSVEKNVVITATPPPPAEVTMQYWMPSCDTQCWEPHQGWTVKYSEMHPNIKWEFKGQGWADFWKKLPLDLAAGTGPDMWWHHIFMTSLAVDGHIEPLPDEMVKQLRETHDRIDSHIINGRLYSFDEGVMFGLVYYNKQMWKDAGLTENDYPKTWADLAEIAKALTVKDSTGQIQRAGFIPEVSSLWIALKYMAGEFNFNEGGTKVYINTEGGKQAAQMILDFIKKDQIFSEKMPLGNEAFRAGLAAMAYNFTWFTGDLHDLSPDLEYGVFNPPTLDGKVAPAYDRGNTEATSVVSSHTTLEKKLIGLDFIKWYTNDPDIMKQRAKIGVAPVLKSIQKDPDLLADQDVAALLREVDRTVWMGYPPMYEESNATDIADAVIMSGTMTVEEGLKASQKRIQEAIDDRMLAGDPVYWGYQEHTYSHKDELHIPELLE